MEKIALAREASMSALPATPVPVDELSRPSLELRTTGEVVDPFSEPFAKPEPDDGSVTPALGNSPPTSNQLGGDTKPSSGQRVSMYVQAFEDMLNTVLAQESYLFTEHEISTFSRYRALSYNASYLLIRLLLRQPRIHRLSHLAQSYGGELGPHLEAAVDEICVPLTDGVEAAAPSAAEPSSVLVEEPASDYPKNKKTNTIVIDLTEDEEREDPNLARALRESLKSLNGLRPGGPSRTASSSSSSSSASASRKGKEREKLIVEGSGGQLSADIVAALSLESKPLDLSWFCRSAEDEDEERLLRCLRLDELREVAKGMKIGKNGMTYDALISTLLSTSRTQSVLAFPVIPRTDTPSNGKGKVAAKPSFFAAPRNKQSTISFPSNTPTSGANSGVRTSLVNSRLSTIIKGIMGRTVIINPDIRRLWKRLNLVFYRSTTAPPSLLLPQILTKAHKRTYPSYPPERTLSLFPTRSALIQYEQALLLELEVDDALGEQETLNGRRPFAKNMGPNGKPSFGNTLGRREGAEVVRGIFQLIFDRWKALVAEAKEAGFEGLVPRAIADRFQPGHVLTRIMYKSAYCLGVLHDFDKECEVLRELLGQRIWRRGKRGAWYERLALILMTHYKGEESMEKKEEAIDVCIDGLEDEDTHLIYRPSLSRRLARLEKQLKLPPEECHRCEAEQKTSEIVTLAAERIRRPVPNGNDDDEELDELELERGARGETAEGEAGKLMGLKSAWVGRGGLEVGVEQWVLEQWEDKGWKGFHAEGSILTTIFGLLFWDVLFSPMPGAFETAFQSAPLDLGEDSFARARSSLVAVQLAEIEAGRAPEILAAVDDRERPTETMCVGVRWEYEKQDLVEIVECFGGTGLSIICRMLCEEYGHRNSGVPDLIVWQRSTLSVRFIEVKGPGDQLSSTQRVWIDVFLSAGIAVEVCRVVERETGTPILRGTEKRPAARSRSSSVGGGCVSRGGGGKKRGRSTSSSVARDYGDDEYNGGGRGAGGPVASHSNPKRWRASRSISAVQLPAEADDDDDDVVCLDD